MVKRINTRESFMKQKIDVSTKTAFCIAIFLFMFLASASYAAAAKATYDPNSNFVSINPQSMDDLLALKQNPGSFLAKNGMQTSLHENESWQSKETAKPPIPAFVPGEIVFRLKKDVITMPPKSNGFVGITGVKINSSNIQKLLKQYSISKMREISTKDGSLKIYALRFNKKYDVKAVASSFSALPEVKYAEPNYIYQVSFVPNDPLYNEQEHQQLIHSEQAWDVEQGENNIRIAVIDTGVDMAHLDMAPNLAGGFDTVDINLQEYLDMGFNAVDGEDYVLPDGVPSDRVGHGTHVAGIVSAATNNGVGVAGVCPNCRMMPVRSGFGLAFDGFVYGFLENDDSTAGIIWAAENEASVLSMSWGGEGESQAITDALQNAHDAHDAVLVASAGNSMSSEPSYPAATRNVISVAANSGENHIPAWFSNYGESVDIAAPGVNILSLRARGTNMAGDGNAIVQEQYLRASGTSMAAPIVSGVAGLVRSLHPGWQNDQVSNQIIGSAAHVDRVYYSDGQGNKGNLMQLGAGSIDSLRALTVQPQPAITIDSISMHDVNGNHNTYINPGETLELNVGLKNWWANAQAVSARLSTDDQHIRMTRDNIQLGRLDGGQIRVTDNFKFSADNDVQPLDFVHLVLTVNADGNEFPFDLYFLVQRPDIAPHGPALKQGWPFISTFSITESPTLADVNNDGQKEIILPSSEFDYPVWNWQNDQFHNQMREINILRPNGMSLPGWPKQVSSQYEPINAADIDGDGNFEVLAATDDVENMQNRLQTSIELWHQNGAAVEGWPLRGEPNAYLYPHFFDLNRDGSYEIITSSRDGTLILNDRGEQITLIRDVWPWQLAVANLDNDNDLEFVFWSIPDEGRTVYAYNMDGNPVEGWPVALDNGWMSYTDLLAGDLNGDGMDEVVFSPGDGRIFVFAHDGQVLSQWRLPERDDSYNRVTELALADLNNDGTPEIIGADFYATLLRVHAWDAQGNEIDGFPSESQLLYHNRWDYAYISAAPTVADVDNDGSNEILIPITNYGWVDEQKVVYIAAIESNGQPKNDVTWPLVPDHNSMLRFGGFYGAPSVIIDDIDADNRLDLVLATAMYNTRWPDYWYGGGGTFVYDLGVAPRAHINDWPQYRHDAQHSGNSNGVPARIIPVPV